MKIRQLSFLWRWRKWRKNVKRIKYSNGSQTICPEGFLGSGKSKNAYFRILRKGYDVFFDAGVFTSNKISLKMPPRGAAVTLTRALRARRARPPEVPENLAALQPRAQRA